jgi:hypothetical protein
METSNKLTGEQLSLWTSSAVDIPASHSVPRANDEEQTTLDICGHGYEQPLANYDLDTQSWRTCGDISLWGEQPLLESLPKSGMTRNGVLFQQPAWVHLIDAIASLSWPTPTAVTRPMEGNVRMYRAKIEAGEMTEAEAEAILGKSVWEAQGKVPAMWPTPTTQENEHPNATWNEQMRRVAPNGSTHSMNLADAVKIWPTPTARDGKRASGHKLLKRRLADLTVQARVADGKTNGSLNPTWVEWLMGFPLGWTDLED